MESLASDAAHMRSPLQPRSDSSSALKSSVVKRRKTSPEALRILEDAYAAHPMPDKYTRYCIGDSIKWDPRSVQVWFQNRRQRDKRERETAAYYSSQRENEAPTPAPRATAPPLSLPRPPLPPSTAATPIRRDQHLSVRSMIGPYPAVARTLPKMSRSAMSHVAGAPPGSQVWRLLPSSPDPLPDQSSSSPVKAEMGSGGLGRIPSLSFMASRPQIAADQAPPKPATLAHAGGPLRLASSPFLNVGGEVAPPLNSDLSDSDGSETTEEALTPNSSVMGLDPRPSPPTTLMPSSSSEWALKIDDRDRECAALLLQLGAPEA